MSASLNNLGAITMFVESPARSKTFYQDVFGLQVVFEDDVSVMFSLGHTIVNLLQVSEAPGLIAPARVAGSDSGSRFMLSIFVDDTNAVCEDLKQRGAELLNGPIDRPWGMRTACVADPDGHIWEIAQDLSKTAIS
jgi:catechol 2,3-dioxygenase-like lactoylglutathione lyase family enzyme